jgi:aspartate aminotransferase/aminotransferase
MKPLATPAVEMPRSAIRVFLDLASAIPDAIHLEIGQPDFPTPPHIVEAALRAAREGYTKYTVNAGLPSLREAVTRKLRAENGIETSPANIVVTVGAMGGLFSVTRAIGDRGDEILVPDPGYPNYEMMARLCDVQTVPYPLDPDRGFQPDLDALDRLVSPRTKAIIVVNPSNPAGAIWPRQTVADLVALADRHDLYVISDECYERIVFDAPHVSAGAFDRDGRVIGVYSFSKTYSMTGWRIGYVVAADPLVQVVAKLQEPTIGCASSISQKAAEAALDGPQDCVAEMVATYRRRRDLAVDILRRNGRYRYTPQGAFYLLVDIGDGIDSYQFAEAFLRQEKVAVTPGRTFGARAGQYVRVSLAARDEDIQTGLERLCRFAAGS